MSELTVHGEKMRKLLILPPFLWRLAYLSAIVASPVYGAKMHPTVSIHTIAKSGIVLQSATKESVSNITHNFFDTAALKDFLPCSAVMTNTTAVPVTAIGAIFRSTSHQKKDSEDHRVILYNLDANPSRMILLAGESRILSPASSLTYAYSSIGRGHKGQSIKASHDAHTWCGHQKHLEIILDAVVFSNGLLVGDDSGHLQRRLNAQIAAINDLSRDILDQSNGSASLTDWLQGIATPETTITNPKMVIGDALQSSPLATSASSRSIRASEEYLQTRKAYAGIFLGYVQNNSEQKLKEHLVPGILSSPHIPDVYTAPNPAANQ